MQDSQTILKGRFLLKRFPGKGGWTYLDFDKKQLDASVSSMWTEVEGRIDSYTLKNAKLAVYGGGKLFLPVRAEIRKSIGKEAGDIVDLELYARIETAGPTASEDEILDCFKLAGVFGIFMSMPEQQKEACLKWISEARQDQVKIRRINITIDRLLMGHPVA